MNVMSRWVPGVGFWSAKGPEIEHARALGHGYLEDLHNDCFISFLSLALAGVRKEQGTKMSRAEHYFIVDNRKEDLHNSVIANVAPAAVVNLAASIYQAGLRFYNGDGREQLKDYESIFKFVAEAFPLETDHVEQRKSISKLWQYALEGLNLCLQTYGSNGNTEFYIKLKDQYHHFSTNRISSEPTSKASNIALSILHTRRVWTQIRIKEVEDELRSIESSPTRSISSVQLKFEERHLEFVNMQNESLSGMLWNKSKSEKSISPPNSPSEQTAQGPEPTCTDDITGVSDGKAGKSKKTGGK